MTEVLYFLISVFQAEVSYFQVLLHLVVEDQEDYRTRKPLQL